MSERPPDDIEMEVLDGQAEMRRHLVKPGDVQIKENEIDQLNECRKRDTEVYNELIAHGLETVRKCKQYQTQFNAMKLVMDQLKARREMLGLHTTAVTNKRREISGLSGGREQPTSEAGHASISGLN